MSILNQIRVVLVEPTHPGNIGAVARAIKTMGLSRLVLVNPKKYPHYEASKRAAGAESVLEAAQVVTSVSQAIADCTLVLGTSVRDREVSWPILDPHESAHKAVQHLTDETRQVALLFGRESSGLSNPELDMCDAQIRIPANADYSSLNLASAVQIILYEMRMKILFDYDGPEQSETPPTGIEQRQQLATRDMRDGHLGHLQSTLESLDFVKAKPPTILMRKLTRLYNKAELTVEEIQILRGILSAVDAKIVAGAEPHQAQSE